MRLYVHHVHEHDPELESRLGGIERTLNALLKGMHIMAKSIDELIAQAGATREQIRRNRDLDQSIMALVNANAQTIRDLRAQLDAAGQDPEKLQALSDAMDALAREAEAEGQDSVEAVRANTSAAPGAPGAPGAPAAPAEPPPVNPAAAQAAPPRPPTPTTGEPT